MILISSNVMMMTIMTLMTNRKLSKTIFLQ